MSLFRDSLRPPPLASDEAVRRYLVAIRAHLDPDPLFRRRLRGVVVNHFVAEREGVAQPARRASEMGRIGRACLYASVALAMSVGGVMGASRGALPGELLYSVKLQVENLRVAVLPAHLHDDLAVLALGERINELGRVTGAGDWVHSASLAIAISDGYDELAALGVTDVAAEGALAQGFEVLAGLRDRLPPQAEAAIQRAMEHAPGLNGTAPGLVKQESTSTGVVPIDQPGSATNRPVEETTEAGGGEGEGPSDAAGLSPEPSPEPSPTARPTASPRPNASPRPSHGSSAADGEALETEGSTGN